MTDIRAAIARAVQNQANVPPDAPRATPARPGPTLPSGYRALLAAADGVVREIVELHGPKPFTVRPDGTVSWWECGGCEFSGYDGEPPHWPCQTTDLIAERLEVSLREDTYVVESSTTDGAAA